MRLTKTQVAVILSGVYIFLQMAADIAATKVIVLGRLVMDAGIIYAFTFTWRDVIHKQLGKKAAQTAIILAGIINIIMALYFQFAVMLPPEPVWGASFWNATSLMVGTNEASRGAQAAWEFIFGLIPRIVIASIIAEVVSELIDTEVYQWWTTGFGKKKPQWLRVIISNSISIPIDSIIFPAIAFSGVLSIDVLWIMVLSNILVKAIVTILSFWMIYLVPEKKMYVGE
ncbi:queuosine precursor transporter [Candidatus Woesearchaeota archaeon]|nr:queuosine precursor transporter [Candidatus Woesearchaeota archaeon]